MYSRPGNPISTIYGNALCECGQKVTDLTRRELCISDTFREGLTDAQRRRFGRRPADLHPLRP